MNETYVWVRISTDEQANTAQIDNIKAMLTKRDEMFPPKRNFMSTVVSRRRVIEDPEFMRLMQLVDDGTVNTIYVESRDRFGIANNDEWNLVIARLRKAKTKLIDLKNDKDLTADELTTNITNLVDTDSNRRELENTAYRTTRTKAQNFKATGSTGSGSPPIGYGRACYASDGTPLWLWCPGPSRTRGTSYRNEKNDWIKKGTEEPIPGKYDKSDVLKPYPNIAQPHFVEAVRKIFVLYVEGLSRRAISKWLNENELTRYDEKPWTHTTVTEVLDNQHYVGDGVFGKRRTGELKRVGPEGEVINPEDDYGHEPLIATDNHQGIIKREVWLKAAQKRTEDRKRNRHPGRNPDYWLAPLLACGHCGRRMCGDKKSDGTVIYVCGTYRQRKANGEKPTCGYQTITHTDAEALLMAKVDEIGAALTLPVRQSRPERGRWKKCDANLDEAIRAGAKFIGAYLGWTEEETRNAIALILIGEDPQGLLRTICNADRAIAERDEKEFSNLDEQHTTFTLAKAQASERERQKLASKLTAIEEQLEELEKRRGGLINRVSKAEDAYQNAHDDFFAMQRKLKQNKGPAVAAALGGIFGGVKLYWLTKHHPPEKTPTRPRKTARNGRFSYQLLLDRTEFEIVGENCVVHGTW